MAAGPEFSLRGPRFPFKRRCSSSKCSEQCVVTSDSSLLSRMSGLKLVLCLGVLALGGNREDPSERSCAGDPDARPYPPHGLSSNAFPVSASYGIARLVGGCGKKETLAPSLAAEQHEQSCKCTCSAGRRRLLPLPISHQHTSAAQCFTTRPCFPVHGSAWPRLRRRSARSRAGGLAVICCSQKAGGGVPPGV